LGVDGYRPAIEESKSQKIHDKYIVGDIKKLNTLIKRKSFDATIALDVIEHLKKEDGYRLLDSMERAARKRVILVTPNGFVPQFNKDNKLQAHLSGWTVDDFVQKGYEVEGIYGTKFCNIFRNEQAELKWKPQALWKLVWGLLFVISHYLYTKKHPKHSIGLLAVKRLD
jgi:2-polyprenyl-3-methyl-5-hydroxy-6-metoxy-1,4-benzoquinol methylase